MEHLHVALATLKLAALRGQNREAVAFANEQFTAIAQTDLPNDASVPFVLAALRIEQARSESTSVAKEKAYRAALALVPAHPDALYELGRLQADTALLRKASGARTKWLPPRRTLADVLLSRGDMTAALQAAREALQNEPNDPASLRIFALASESLGEKAAWERLGHALHAMPNDGELLMAEARLLHRKGEHEAALEKLERVAALQMANPTPYIECAKIALATSRPRLAGGYLDQALSRDPKNTTALGLCKKTNCQKLK